MQENNQFVPQGYVTRNGMSNIHGDMVHVEIYLQPGYSTDIVDGFVYEIQTESDRYGLIIAWVEITKLETLALLDGVKCIRTVIPPVVRVGSKQSEGDALHFADLVRMQYGTDGIGVKIGVISDGVNTRATSIASGDLPAYLTNVGPTEHVLSDAQGGDEGTAMLEIIHDLAPGAELYFHDCGSNKLEFNNAVSNLAAAGCDIIVDDIGWVTEEFYEDGIIAEHIASVINANPNLLYLSSAGNAARSHYQGNYYQIPTTQQHDFSHGTSPGAPYIYINMPAESIITVVLQWNDPWGLSANDYDLYLFDDANPGEPIGVSGAFQDGDDLPLEAFTYTNTTGQILMSF